MIPLTAFPYTIYGDRIVLDFFKCSADYEKFQNIVELLRSVDGSLISRRFLFNKIYAILRDLRKTRLVMRAIKYFYEYEPPCKPDYQALLKFYKMIQDNYHGAIKLKERTRIIKEIADKLGVQESDLLKMLICDNVELNYFKKKREVDARTLLRVSNFLILDKAIKMSEKVEITFLGEVGTPLKVVLWRAKRGGILADFNINNDSLKCIFEGPRSILETPGETSYGRLLSVIVLDALWKFKPWKLRIFLIIRGRKYFMRASSESYWAPDFLPPWVIGEKMIKFRRFDSKDEMLVFRILMDAKESMNVEVERESSPLILPNGKIFIPDFTVRKGNKIILIEVIGFWTKSYHEKKLEKLRALWKEGVRNLLLLINEKLREIYHSIPFDKIFYRTTKAGVRSLKKDIMSFLRGL